MPDQPGASPSAFIRSLNSLPFPVTRAHAPPPETPPHHHPPPTRVAELLFSIHPPLAWGPVLHLLFPDGSLCLLPTLALPGICCGRASPADLASLPPGTPLCPPEGRCPPPHQFCMTMMVSAGALTAAPWPPRTAHLCSLGTQPGTLLPPDLPWAPQSQTQAPEDSLTPCPPSWL